jgi:hypothetical protein
MSRSSNPRPGFHFRRILAAILATAMLTGFGVAGSVVSASAVAETGTIVGTVTGGGNGLDGIYLTALGDPGWQGVSAGGSYTISDVPAGTYSVIASDSSLDFATTTVTDVVVVAGEATTLDVVMPARDNFSIEGTVTDADGPVVGLTVSAYHSFDSQPGRSAVTDAVGHYVIDHLASTSINIYAGGTGTDYVQFNQSNQVAGPTTYTYDIVLTRVATGTGVISGTVIDQSTLGPIAGVQVSVSITDLSW